jgi:hypothetical protein
MGSIKKQPNVNGVAVEMSMADLLALESPRRTMLIDISDWEKGATTVDEEEGTITLEKLIKQAVVRKVIDKMPQYTGMHPNFIRVQVQDGELHLSLTGWVR